MTHNMCLDTELRHRNSDSDTSLSTPIKTQVARVLTSRLPELALGKARLWALSQRKLSGT